MRFGLLMLTEAFTTSVEALIAQEPEVNIDFPTSYANLVFWGGVTALILVLVVLVILAGRRWRRRRHNSDDR